MLKIREAIVVEGRYDKIALEPLVDAPIFTTDGFGIFRDREKMALLRSVAEKRGLIVLTDSDGAGLVIRSRIRGCIEAKYLKHAYIPDVPGKERRKSAPSREGTLGVEGMAPGVLLAALERCGATPDGNESDPVTKADLYALGLSGAEGSAERRLRLQKRLGLPANLSANALLEAVNALWSRDGFLAAAAGFAEEDASERNSAG